MNPRANVDNPKRIVAPLQRLTPPHYIRIRFNLRGSGRPLLQRDNGNNPSCYSHIIRNNFRIIYNAKTNLVGIKREKKQKAGGVWVVGISLVLSVLN